MSAKNPLTNNNNKQLTTRTRDSMTKLGREEKKKRNKEG